MLMSRKEEHLYWCILLLIWIHRCWLGCLVVRFLFFVVDDLKCHPKRVGKKKLKKECH